MEETAKHNKNPGKRKEQEGRVSGTLLHSLQTLFSALGIGRKQKQIMAI